MDDIHATVRALFAAKLANGGIPRRIDNGELDGLEYFPIEIDGVDYWLTDALLIAGAILYGVEPTLAKVLMVASVLPLMRATFGGRGGHPGRG